MPAALAAVTILTAGVAAPASASELLDRDGTQIQLRVDNHGRALVSYEKAGRHKSVLVWGAVNALSPTRGGKQVSFELDYSGNGAKGFSGRCGRYDGPALPFAAAACKAPDGSYWAVQEWPEPLPDLGFSPWLPAQRSLWMNVSHWRGPVAQLEAYPDWVYSGTFHAIFGRYTYGGSPVYGFSTNNTGVPTDSFGRLVFLDTYGSIYSDGWARENSFVSHNPTGVFCYGFYQFDPTKGGYVHPPGATEKRGPGVGTKYRLIAIGPGVTPDVEALVTDPGDFDRNSPDRVQFRLKQWRLFSTFIGQDKQCRQGRALGAVNLVAASTWFSPTPGGDSTPAFTLGSHVYFNVKFTQSAPTSGGKLQATVTWTHRVGDRVTMRFKTANVTLSQDGVVASAPFDLAKPNNKRFIGTWQAILTVNGLQIADATVEASLAAGTLVNIAPPVISGSPAVGTTLSATPGTWSFTPARLDYRWTRCPATSGACVNLGTGPTYTLGPADVGWRIEVWVTAWTPSGSSLLAIGIMRDLVGG